jgi:hypothetical protein
MRVQGLPVGIQDIRGDPWEEAVRRRARGDFAGAVVYLFAHQLLVLERLKQIRLMPGRTGRQYVRSVADPALRAVVEPTLRLFETVYYGRRVPPAEAFEAVWTLAEGWQRRSAPIPGAGQGQGLLGSATILVILGVLGLSGCSKDLNTTYGRVRGNSINGTGVFADALRSEGHDVRVARRLTVELEEWADLIVRFAPYPGPPEREEAEWYLQWLDGGLNRRILYVPYDFNADHEYWSEVLAELPKEASPRLRKAIEERDRASLGSGEEGDAPEHVANAVDWFATSPVADSPSATCQTLSGPWSAGVDSQAAALPRHRTLKPQLSETVLLAGDGKPLAITWSRYNASAVLVIANASFLLNAPMVKPARRQLTRRVVNWIGQTPGHKVAFVEGGSVLGSSASAMSVWGLLKVPPFGWIAAQFFVLGLAACLARAPRLGRARPDPPTEEDRPAAHAEALGDLLAKTQQDQTARSILETYHRWRFATARASQSPHNIRAEAVPVRATIP